MGIIKSEPEITIGVIMYFGHDEVMQSNQTQPLKEAGIKRPDPVKAAK
jgi:hypothetical protein